MSENKVLAELRAELKDAMRARDQRRTDVIRLIETEVSKAKTAADFEGEVDEALYLEVIAAYAKKMQKAIGEYKKVGERGVEMVEKLTFEVDYLARWLPKKLDEAAVRDLVRQAIAELGITDPKQAGRVVGHLMKRKLEGLDGGTVSRLAREELSA